MSIAIAFYADLFSPHGKGPRLTTLNKRLLDENAVARIYCRRSLSESRIAKSLPWGVSVLCRSLGALQRIQTAPIWSDRNCQEDIFDFWLRDQIVERSIFIAPGFWQTISAHSRNKEIFSHSVVCHPDWVMKCTLHIKSTANRLGYNTDFRSLTRECDRVRRSLRAKPTLVFPSKAVKKTYEQYESNDYLRRSVTFESQELSKKPGKEIPKEPRIAFVGSLSFLKGLHVLLSIFQHDLRKFNLDVYGPFVKNDSAQLLEKITKINNVRYLGYKSPDEISQSCDVVVVPSFIDAEPRVVREFLERGVNVVASSHITSIEDPQLTKFDLVGCELKELVSNMASAILAAVELRFPIEKKKSIDNTLVINKSHDELLADYLMTLI